jgi:hypothetical protein
MVPPVNDDDVGLCKALKEFSACEFSTHGYAKSLCPARSVLVAILQAHDLMVEVLLRCSTDPEEHTAYASTKMRSQVAHIDHCNTCKLFVGAGFD